MRNGPASRHVVAACGEASGKVLVRGLSISLLLYLFFSDKIVWVSELPMTATGKVSKLTLRERYRYHLHPAPV